ncbi:MAG: RNA polymerase sigma factor [Desulfurispora sp.]|uniref:RNA polymerase sigma factor n=1 Tax=Desulfurispora sp. TaxID=3014275 RepID=UPI004049F7FD
MLTAAGKAPFTEVYEANFARINRYLRYRLADSWEADDLTAQVFLKALEKYDYFRGEVPVHLWLLRLAHNLLVDYYRRGRVRLEPVNLEGLPAATVAVAADTPEERLLQEEELRQLRLCLLALPADYQEVLSLRYGADLKFAEIGRVLGRSEAVVRMWHWRGLKALRRALVQQGEKKRGEEKCPETIETARMAAR